MRCLGQSFAAIGDQAPKRYGVSVHVGLPVSVASIPWALTRAYVDVSCRLAVAPGVAHRASDLDPKRRAPPQEGHFCQTPPHTYNSTTRAARGSTQGIVGNASTTRGNTLGREPRKPGSLEKHATVPGLGSTQGKVETSSTQGQTGAMSKEVHKVRQSHNHPSRGDWLAHDGALRSFSFNSRITSRHPQG